MFLCHQVHLLINDFNVSKSTRIKTGHNYNLTNAESMSAAQKFQPTTQSKSGTAYVGTVTANFRS